MFLLHTISFSSFLFSCADNVLDVLSGATHIQILPVISACENYLIDHLMLENCINAANVAELFSLKHLQQHVFNFVCRNWAAFSVGSDFHDLSPQFLVALLSCGYPMDCKEIDILMSVLSWFSYAPVARAGHMTSVFRCILFDSISPNEFSSAMNSKQWLELTDGCPRLIENIPALAKLCKYSSLEEQDTIISVTNYSPAIKSSVSVTRIEVRQQPCFHLRKLQIPGLINSRGFHSSIVVAGGFRKESGMTNNVLYLDNCTGFFKHLTKIPHLDQINFGMAVYQNQLYIVGGCFNDHMQEIAHPFGFCYSPTSDEWVSIAPMLQERCRFLLCATEERIYAIGGDPCASDVGPEDVAPSEVYYPKLNKWKSVSPLPGNRSQLAGTSHGRCVLVSGGILESEEMVFQDFYMYEPRTNMWERKADMLTPRADHSMFVWEDKVYVIGGWHLDPVTKHRVMAAGIDHYDFSTDSWEEIGSLNRVRTYGTYTLSRDCIYAIGGWCDGDHSQKCHTVDTFNLRYRTWVQGHEQKIALWEHSSCSLYLPKFVPSLCK